MEYGGSFHSNAQLYQLCTSLSDARLAAISFSFDGEYFKKLNVVSSVTFMGMLLINHMNAGWL